MKSLETTFTLDNFNFTQVKRNDKAAIYKRETLDGQFVSFDVFAIMTKNDSEVYPNQKAVLNKWCFCPIDENRAETWFNRIVNGEIPIPQVDPETGDPLPVAEEPSLDELPNVEVETAEVTPPVVADPTVPETTPVVNVTPDGGAVVTVAKVTKTRVTYIIPAGEFTANDFADANGLRRRKGVWGRIQNEIEAGRVVFVKQTKVGKGRPTSFYTAAPAPAVPAAPAPVAS